MSGGKRGLAPVRIAGIREEAAFIHPAAIGMVRMGAFPAASTVRRLEGVHAEEGS